MRRSEILKYLPLLVLYLAVASYLVMALGLWTTGRKLSAASISQEQGMAYVVDLSNLSPVFPFSVGSDGAGRTDSTLLVYEDGRRLWPGHSSHANVRQSGAGAYSHWDGKLYFSTSDGSDPRTNGRIYRVYATVTLAPSVSLAFLVVAVAGVLLTRRSWPGLSAQSRSAVVAFAVAVEVTIIACLFLTICKSGQGWTPKPVIVALALTVASSLLAWLFHLLDILKLRDSTPQAIVSIICFIAAFVFVFALVMALGLLPPLNVGAKNLEPLMSEQAKPAGLVAAILRHAVGGLMIAFVPFIIGGGLVRWTGFGRKLSLHGVLLAGYPVGLVTMAACVFAGLVVPSVWIGAALIAIFAVAGWVKHPVSAQLLTRYASLVAVILPFGLLYALWISLDWHGPFAGAGGLTSGDLSFYSNSVWVLHRYGLPMPNLGVDGDHFALVGFPNMLLPAIAAQALNFVPLDPYLFMTSSSTMIYAVGMGILLTAFMSDYDKKQSGVAISTLLILALVGAGRYPYWVTESVPVAHAMLLSICILWYMDRASLSVPGITAGLALGIAGSAVSKVVTAALFAATAASPFFSRVTAQIKVPKKLLILLLAVSLAYFGYMIAAYGKIFLLIGRFGPESYRYYFGIGANLIDAWPFVARDIGVAMLLILSLMCVPFPLSASFAFAFGSFLAYSYLLQINMVTGLLMLALYFFIRPDTFRRAPVLWVLAIALTVPAMLFTDASGFMSGPIWIVIATGVAACSIAFSQGPALAILSPARVWRLSAGTAGILALLMVAVGQKHLSVATHAVSIPYSVTDIWTSVRESTDADTLVFTDQTSLDDIGMTRGWNSVSYSGTRQVYISSWVQSALRTNDAARIERINTNEAVLSGRVRPDQITVSRSYRFFAAVVAKSRTMPADWKLVHSNGDWSLYSWRAPQ